MIPQPELREEDECPICHGALPPKGHGGSETDREAHVAMCIESHFLGSSQQASRLPPVNFNTSQAADTARLQATNERFSHLDSPNVAAPGTTSSQSSSFFKPRRRTTGMIVYLASEKDCVGEDGEESQECVICFEEFTVGDEMGRLECLCKFHKVNFFNFFGE